MHTSSPSMEIRYRLTPVFATCTDIPVTGSNCQPCQGQMIFPSKMTPSESGPPRWGQTLSIAASVPFTRATHTGLPLTRNSLARPSAGRTDVVPILTFNAWTPDRSGQSRKSFWSRRRGCYRPLYPNRDPTTNENSTAAWLRYFANIVDYTWSGGPSFGCMVCATITWRLKLSSMSSLSRTSVGRFAIDIWSILSCSLSRP